MEGRGQAGFWLIQEEVCHRGCRLLPSSVNNFAGSFSPGHHEHSLAAKSIRFQSRIFPRGRDGIAVPNLARNMRRNGWKGKLIDMRLARATERLYQPGPGSDLTGYQG